MNIKDSSKIFAIRHDQNKGDYFKAFVGQVFPKNNLKVVDIYQDLNELMVSGDRVYKVIAVEEGGAPFVWREFENPTNLSKINEIPNLTEIEQINRLYESDWD
jgi:predicted phage-related endonuclease